MYLWVRHWYLHIISFLFVIFQLFQTLYLDFLHYFPDKLQEVIDLLVEKEHRVRIPLEELDLLLANKGNITSRIQDTNAESESVKQCI